MSSQQRDRPQLPVQKILVVEDDPAYRRIVALQLRSLGWTCLTASTHAEALEQLADGHEIDVVLLDYAMYGNGPETFVQEIKKLKRQPYVVGHSSMNRRRDFAALGIQRFVRKPLPVEQLTALVIESTADPSKAQA